MVEFVIGAARSGKSRYASARATEAMADGTEVVMIATAIAGDDEMRDRIAHHRRTRPESWRTVEEPYALAASLRENAAPQRLVIVDCLTLWLTNLHYGDVGVDPAGQIDDLVETVAALSGEVVLVSNEIGAGPVAADAASRRFVDDLGRLNQRVAAACDTATLIVAGMPVTLKGAPG